MYCNNALTASEVPVHLAESAEQRLLSKIDSPLERYLERSICFSRRTILSSSAKTRPTDCLTSIYLSIYVHVILKRERDRNGLEWGLLLRVSYSTTDHKTKCQRNYAGPFTLPLEQKCYSFIRATILLYEFHTLKSHDSYPRPSIVAQWHYITEQNEPRFSYRTFDVSHLCGIL